jgi:hypothetical protein
MVTVLATYSLLFGEISGCSQHHYDSVVLELDIADKHAHG